jgi:hypothetical protein
MGREEKARQSHGEKHARLAGMIAAYRKQEGVMPTPYGVWATVGPSSQDSSGQYPYSGEFGSRNPAGKMDSSPLFEYGG